MFLEQAWLRQICLDGGLDDVGFVESDRPELAPDRSDILKAFPRTKTLISFVSHLNREPIRSSAQSIANLEFHHTGDHPNEVDWHMWKLLESRGQSAYFKPLAGVSQVRKT